MRPLFSDGINSLAHVAFGALGSELVAIAFVGYQLVGYATKRDDVVADVLEFLVGWVLGGIFVG